MELTQVECLNYVGIDCDMRNNITSQHDFVSEAVRVVEEAQKHGVILRMMGATAIRHHCPAFASLHTSMGRQISDIDFVTYEKQSSKVEKLLQTLGYVIRPMSYSFIQGGRLIFENKDSGTHVDVFMDRLSMCHTIDYTTRLEVDYPTVPLAELLLQKMQIVKLSEKDVIDTTILLLEHDVGRTDKETVNLDYIAGMLAQDWGFWYTIRTNLVKVKSLLPGFQALEQQHQNRVAERIDSIVARLDDEPKSTGWKMRAGIGTKKKWYKEI